MSQSAARNLSNNEVKIPHPAKRSYVQAYVDSDLRDAVDNSLEKINKGLKTGDKKVTMTDVISHGLKSFLLQADQVAAKRLGID